MTARKWLVAVGILCLFAVAASAEWERTINAFDSRLPAQGKLQLALWGLYFESDNAGADVNEMDGTAYLNYGIKDKWSASIAPGVTRWDVDNGDSESGLADTKLLTTYRFLYEADAGLDLAIMGRVLIPTGDDDKGLGTGHVEPGLLLIAAKTIGPIIVVGNAGGSLILNPNRGEEDFILGGALEGIYPLSDRLNLNAVCSASTARMDGGDDTVDVGVGARFTPLKQFFLLGGIYTCLTDAYDWGIQVATGYEF